MPLKTINQSNGIEELDIRITKLQFTDKCYIAEVKMHDLPYRVHGFKTDTVEDFVAECEKWYNASNFED